MPRTVHELEAMTATAAAAVLASATDSVQDLATTIAYLLAARLQDDVRWSRYHWIDDFLPTRIERESTTVLRLWGHAIWGKDRTTEQWVELFFARIVLSDGGARLSDYAICFAYVNDGLGRVPYGRHSAARGDAPRDDEWMFVVRAAE